MKNMKSHLMLGALAAFSFAALNATGAPMSADARRIPLPAKATPAQALPGKTLPKKAASLPTKKAKKAATLPAKKPTQKVKITFDSAPGGDSSIVIVERDFGLSTNPATNVKRKLLAQPDFNYSSNSNILDLPYEEEGQPLLQRIYDEETGPPPASAASVSPTQRPSAQLKAEVAADTIETTSTGETNSAPSNASRPTAPFDWFSNKPALKGDQAKQGNPTASQITVPSTSVAASEPELPTSQRPSRFEMLAPPVAPQPQPQTAEAQVVANSNRPRIENEETNATQALSTKVSTATSAVKSQSRFSIGTGYLNTKYDRIASELKNGATTLNFALARNFGAWEASLHADIAHGMDQSVTIANTRSLMLRAQGLRLFNATSTLKPLLGASAGLGDINVRSYRDDGSGKVSLREHASGMAFSISGTAGIRALMNHETNSISADLLLDATALSGAGEISKLGGIGARLMIGFGL